MARETAFSYEGEVFIVRYEDNPPMCDNEASIVSIRRRNHFPLSYWDELYDFAQHRANTHSYHMNEAHI